MLLTALLILFGVWLSLPPLLVIAFNLWAWSRRVKYARLEAFLTVAGGIVDIATNYAWLTWIYGWWPSPGTGLKGLTVTARTGYEAKRALAAGITEITLRGAFAIALCRYMNSRDPGHVKFPATTTLKEGLT